jgi:hypothetical protein
VSFEGPTNFFSGHARKLQVQHDYTGSLLAKAFQASDAVRSNLYCQSIRFEQALQRALHWPTVFYNEYGIHGILCAILFAAEDVRPSRP